MVGILDRSEPGSEFTLTLATSIVLKQRPGKDVRRSFISGPKFADRKCRKYGLLWGRTGFLPMYRGKMEKEWHSMVKLRQYLMP